MKVLLKTYAKLLARIFTSLLFLLVFINVRAQQSTQTIRGVVVDKISQSPLPGAIVQLLNVTPVKGASADVNGNFSIPLVPLGRQSIKVSYVGYKEATIPNITVNAGKETVITIQLEEQIVEAKEVVIKAKVEKNKPLNELSTVSTRTFSVEETQKFAAAVNDPARMATSFAGVVSGSDGNNMISVRGNSPNALLWRMEGVDIPNPNHFSAVGTSGGGISILSAQLMSNSDFLTGAFASEYGNAIGGVFDLKLRKGNNQKREYTFQAGVLGFDVASEGPIKKGYDGSYLVNYRYSTLSVLGLMGVDLGGDIRTNFQDLSFNVSLPTKRFGTFGIFGFGGISSQYSTAKKDSLNSEGVFNFVANTGAIGLSNTKLFGSKTYLKTTLVASGTENAYQDEEFVSRFNTVADSRQSFIQKRLTLSSTLTHKMDARNSIRTGIIATQLFYDFTQKQRNDSTGVMETFLNNNGNTTTVQAFAQWNHKLNSRLTTNLGLHSLLLALNNTYSIEPRASVKYDVSAKQYVALGYGLHSQLQPLGTYFAQTPQTGGVLVNKNLELTKAHHIVLSHDINLNEVTHIKTEVYYQHLFDVPISMNPTSTYSVLNEVEGFTTEPLTNKGLGRNYGLELTLEKFLSNNFYYLLSSSLYQSEYKAANGQWYNTRFNTNYATTFTAGKEWQLSEKRKRKVLGVNTKIMYVGGLRYTPIDRIASVEKGEAVLINAQPFSQQNPDYFRIDLRVSLKRNYSKTTTTLSLDLQNATNRLNVGGQYYDNKTGNIKYWYQLGMLPVLAYKVEF